MAVVLEALTLRCRSPERELVAPRSWAFDGVGSDLKDVVSRRFEAVDCNRRVRRIRRYFVSFVRTVMVDDFVQHDVSVTMLFGRRDPFESDCRRTEANGREIQWRSGRYCNG